MLLGQYQHTLDYKSRTTVPKKFRDELKTHAILTRGLDNCLFLYSQSEWELLSNRIKELPLTGSDARAFSRYLFGSAIKVDFDSLGRIKIPDHLLEHGRIKKDLVIIGVLNRVEIWSKEIWLEFSAKISKSSEEIAEKLSGSGV